MSQTHVKRCEICTRREAEQLGPTGKTYIIVIHAHGELIKPLRSCNSKGLTFTVVINAVHRATALHNELWDLYNEDPLLNSASGCPGDKRSSYQ